MVPELLRLGGGKVMPPSIDEVRHVVPFGVGVAKSSLLAMVPRGVVAREVCDFLATLTATYPGGLMGASNVMACLCRRGVGVLWLEFVHGCSSSFVLASVGAPCLFRVVVTVGCKCRRGLCGFGHVGFA
jgi:hypothetical protein